MPFPTVYLMTLMLCGFVCLVAMVAAATGLV